MIKKILFLVIFLLVVAPRSVFAQETVTPLPIPSSSVVATSSPLPTEYFLPYPGILPDNPLYGVKVTRDKIVGFLISDSLEKAEFNLHQADKRLNAGIFLMKKKNVDLGQETISKAENYFEDALTSIEKAQEEKKDTQQLADNLYKSVRRHEYEVQQLEKQMSEKNKAEWEVLVKRIDAYQKRVEKIVSNSKKEIKD